MQSSPLRHVAQSPVEFPFSQLDSPASSRPATPTRSPSIAGGNTHQISALFGKGWQGNDDELVRHHEEEQKQFGEKRELLVHALDETTGLVKGLSAFNQDKWTIHYPHQLGVTAATPAGTPQRSQSQNAPETPARSNVLRRSNSLIMDHGDEHGTRPSPPQRAYSTAETPARPAATVAKDQTPAHPLSILSLDLKLGHPSTATAQLPALLPSLSLSTLSQLLSRRLTTSLGHLSQLRSRVIDKNSRILVTGDLNAGKSTFVNALLRREVMPWDQQPCTTVFCEVMDSSNNDDLEEMHAIRDVDKYAREDRSTYDVYPLDQVYEVQEMGDLYQMVKAYVRDGRSPQSTEDDRVNPSFIKNGLVSISLIDAPGLNRDTLSTTALFARQSEIDVIVFVVSAENHFTLSAKEFLWNASREKAYVFIVVNKWNGIRDKRKCMNRVGEQIKQLSPATWDNRHELVHFVDAADYVESVDGEAQVVEEAEEEPSAFDHLEQSLRSFVLLKRSKSKLAPAKHYLLNLLADLSTLATANTIAANTELASALKELERIRPIHERLSAQRDEVEQGVDAVEESVVEVVKNAAWTRLERALEYVSQGQVVPPSESTADADSATVVLDGIDPVKAPSQLPQYPGVLGLWEWAGQVKETLVQALEAEVRSAEDDARLETVDGVKQVMHGLGDKYLPTVSAAEGPEKQDQVAQAEEARVFRPEVMFAKRRRGVGKLAARGIASGLGLGAATSTGLGTNWTANDFDVSFLDLFDLERLYHLSTTGSTSEKRKMITDSDDVVEKGTLVGLGLGSLGMLGSRMVGIKGTMESLNKIVQLVGSKTARKWAGPVIGVLTVGLVVYVIVDLPRAIPRNIGRKLQLSLSSSPDVLSPQSPPITFSTAHSDRIARETRKVLRLAGWDLRERFRAALDQSARERKQVEGVVSRCEGALEFLQDFEDKVEHEQGMVQVIEI
ncbi:mitofusin [Sporobolomyces koalae]|uniref:mitofusin n=1 Tax=Sporobolomyces koalae TaxID=500713 RepID=UPI00316DEBAB